MVLIKPCRVVWTNIGLVMDDPTPEFEKTVEMAFAQLEPDRVFAGCKVANEASRIVVRIYSHSSKQRAVLPPPYEIYCFDPKLRTLSTVTSEETTRYRIPNYK